MVMVANQKSIQQINSDLQLFLGDNTNRFTKWLQGELQGQQLPVAASAAVGHSGAQPKVTGAWPTGSLKKISIFISFSKMSDQGLMQDVFYK